MTMLSWMAKILYLFRIHLRFLFVLVQSPPSCYTIFQEMIHLPNYYSMKKCLYTVFAPLPSLIILCLKCKISSPINSKEIKLLKKSEVIRSPLLIRSQKNQKLTKSRQLQVRSTVKFRTKTHKY